MHTDIQTESFVVLNQVILKNAPWVSRLFNRVVVILNLLTGAVVWPATVLYSMWKAREFPLSTRARRVATMRAKNTIIPYDFFLVTATALFTCLAVFVLLVMNWNGVYSSRLFGALSFFTTGRLVIYALTTRGLLHRVRSAPGNPHLRFLWMGILYALLILAVFLPRQETFPNTLPSLQSTIFATFGFHGLRHFRVLDWHDVWRIQMAVTGFLFYLIILRSLIRFSDFRRRESDIVALAEAFLAKGDFVKALNWLQKAPASSTIVTFHRAIALLGANEVASAKQAMSIALPALQQDMGKMGGSVYSTLLGIARQYPIPPKSVRAVFNEMLREHPREVYVLAGLAHLADLYGSQFVERELDMELVASSCPATYAAWLLRSESPQKAARYLDRADRTIPENGALCRILDLWLLIEEETEVSDRREWLGIWLEESLPAIRETIGEIEETWIKGYAFLALALLADIAQAMDSEFAEQLKFAARELADNLQEEDTTGILAHQVSNIARIGDF